MNPKIINLYSEGDYLLKEAKAQFFSNQEIQCNATCLGCKALKNYLDAYMYFFNDHYKPTSNFHLIIRTIMRLDPEFEKYYAPIFDIKCFAEESKNEGEKFYLYDSEINKAVTMLMEIRNYIANKIRLEKQFLEEYSDSSLMGT